MRKIPEEVVDFFYRLAPVELSNKESMILSNVIVDVGPSSVDSAGRKRVARNVPVRRIEVRKRYAVYKLNSMWYGAITMPGYPDSLGLVTIVENVPDRPTLWRIMEYVARLHLAKRGASPKGMPKMTAKERRMVDALVRALT